MFHVTEFSGSCVCIDRFTVAAKAVLLAVILFLAPIGIVSGQCEIASEGVAGIGAATHVMLDGNWAAQSDGTSLEVLQRDAGSWLIFQSIDLLGATLQSASLEGSDLILGFADEVRLYSFDGAVWNHHSTLSGAIAGSGDPSWGTVLDHSGDLLAVGSPGTDELYFFTRVFDGVGDSTWIAAGSTAGAAGSQMGSTVSLSGDYVSTTSPQTSEVLTFQYQGLASNQWLLDATHPLAVASGTSISLDQSAGEVRLILPSGLGANVFLRGAGGWAPESVLSFQASADPSMTLEGNHALVTTSCGLRLFTRSATGWNFGFMIETVDALLPCLETPAGSGSSPLSLSGEAAMFATNASGTRFLSSLVFTDCNGNGTLDSCEMASGSPDCNGNGIPDDCDFASGTMDCNQNFILDPCEVSQGLADDCDGNGVPDDCDLASLAQDCNGNSLIDSCEIADGLSADCNQNSIPDTCDALAGVIYDSLPPVITGVPADIVITINSGECESPATWQPPTSTDDCSQPTMTSSHDPGALFLSGATTVTYTSTDEAGNSSDAVFQVTILEPDPPFFISVPGNITALSDPVSCEAQVSWPPPFALDANNCSLPSITTSIESGSMFPMGTTTVQVSAIDGGGNEITSSFNVNVIDVAPPVIEQLPDIALTTGGGGCNQLVSWNEPVVSDCSGVTMISTPTSPALVTTAGRVVTYSAVDSTGNTSQMSFIITLTDETPPLITGLPGNVTLAPPPGICGVNFDWALPVITDDCFLSSVETVFEPPALFGVGTTVVSYTASDSSGNSTTESFSVTVLDNDTPQFVSTPGPIEVVTTNGQCDAVVTWEEPVAVDCTSTTLTSTHSSGSLFPIGVQQVFYTASDPLGNSSTVSFSVSVTDGSPPDLVNAPADMTIVANPGECTAVASWPAPTASDNCSAVTLTTNVEPGTALPVGVTAVTYTVSDDAGNSFLHTFFVTVMDTSSPTADIVLQDINADSGLGLCSAQVFWTEPQYTDDCSISQVSQSHPSGAFFDVGVTTVTYTATDAGGNTTTESFNITVADAEAPAFFQMPANIELSNVPGTCEATATWTHPQVIDHCELVTFQVTHNPGDSFPIGETTVTYTSSDSVLNESSQSFTVTVLDQEAPSFTSTQNDLQIPSEVGLCTAMASWPDPTGTDLCGAVTFSSSAPSGSPFSLGTTQVTLTCTDQSGNTTDQTFNVTVVDDEQPQIVGMPESFTISTQPSSCSGLPTWIEPTATDCDSATITSDRLLGSEFSLGDTIVTYTATDPTGNVTTSSFTVTVIDETAPSFDSVPTEITATTEAGTCSASVTWPDATASDHCSPVTITYDHASGSNFSLGTSTVTATATDAASNTQQVSFSVVITDGESPFQVSGPGTQVTVENPLGDCQLPVTWDAPVFADHCSLNPVVSSTHQPGDSFPVGDTLVTYTCHDDALNQVTSSFTVTVLDTTAPSIDFMPQTMVEIYTAEDACDAPATWSSPQASDCSDFVMTSSVAHGTVLPIGTHVVIFTFTDAYGNESTDNIWVVVIDAEIPQINGNLPNISVNNGPGTCTMMVVWAEPTTTDCTFSALETTHAVGSEFPIGTTTVTYTATDSAGNQSHQSFDVTVHDVDPPVIVGLPQTVSVQASAGSCQAVATWTEPTATDCVSHTLSSDIASGTSFPMGDTQVTYTATDPVGNTSTASFTVTVLDVEAPSIAMMPADIVVDSDPGSCSGTATWSDPTTSDCSSTSTLQADYTTGSQFPIGTTTVTYTATDPSGNSSSASFDVTVLDAGTPTISGMPATVTVDNTAGLCSGPATWTAPVVSDCSDVILTGDHSSGEIFQLGSTMVTYTAVDAAGNSTSSSFEVQVLDGEAPFFINVATDLTFDLSPGECVGIATWDPVLAGDLCGTATATSSAPSGTEFPLGISQVTHTAVDSSGNSVSVVTTIHIVDSESPVLSGMPADIVLTAPTGSCSAFASWTEPTGSDCTAVTITSTVQPSSLLEIGVHEVVYSATDQAGNLTEQSFTVTVLDAEAPTISQLPGDLVFTNDPGACGAIVSWEDVVVTDCSDLQGVTSTVLNGGFLEPGETTVTITATDTSGNESQASFNIQVVDTEGPAITGIPALVELPSSPGQCGTLAFWSDPTITDNCGIATIQTSLPQGSFIPTGETVISYVVVDTHGNASTAQMVLTVTDTEAPQIVNLPTVITATPQPSTCTATVSWDPLEFTDNCAGGSIDSSLASGSEFPVGSTQVQVTATDAAGNTSTATFTVLVEECQSGFIRGDTNDDGAFDISDAIVILGYIFNGTPVTCLDALDENDDGSIEISDAIYHFSALFVGGPPPSAPWGQCGLDPTEDSLECELYSSCP